MTPGEFMSEEKSIIGIVGSPNKDGLTNQLVNSALNGCAEAGAKIELIQMSDHVVTACEDCLPWVCKDELECTFEDEAFEFLTEKILNCSGLVFGTPVYWWDTSGMVKYFILKMFRIFAWSSPLNGIPAFGVAIAGGTGNGLISGLRPVYHFLQMMQMRPLEPVPATRFNFDECLSRSKELGLELAELSRNHTPFKKREEGLELYDQLPYLGLNRAEERQLLAELVTLALPEEERGFASTGLAKADALAAANRSLESTLEITKVYIEGMKKYSELKSS